MNPLSQILNDALRRMDSAAGAEVRAVLLWPEIVGDQIARATEAYSLRGGVLTIVTRSESWSTEIGFLKPEILRRYRRRLGADAVTDVRARVGKVRGRSPDTLPQAPPEEEIRRLRLPTGEVEQIREASRSEDPELSQAIRRALTREAQIRHWNLSHGARPCPRCGAPYRTSGALCPACRVEDINAAEP